jgi:hypothetical protein
VSFVPSWWLLVERSQGERRIAEKSRSSTSSSAWQVPPVAAFGQGEIEREKLEMTAMLLCQGTVVFIREEMFEGTEQKGSEPALFGVGALNTLFREQLGEERLGEIAGAFGVTTDPAGERVNGRPVGAAELVEGGAGGSRRAGAGLENHAPMRGGEGCGWRARFH